MTAIDVSAAAREQMRAAVAAREARAVFWEARAAWETAKKAATAADRAYQQACGEALAVLEEDDPGQPGLFDGEG